MFEMLKKMLDELKGQFTISVGTVVALLVTIAIGALGAWVLYSITGALEVEPGSYAENAIHDVEEKGGTAFNLMTIMAIVVVAALIIGVVVRAVGGGVISPRYDFSLTLPRIRTLLKTARSSKFGGLVESGFEPN